MTEKLSMNIIVTIINYLIISYNALSLILLTLPLLRLIQERAALYATELGLDGFTASNGWLHKWQKRHTVHMSALSGEVPGVNPIVVSNWGEQLKTICEGYARKDIFNADETGLFFRALATWSLVVKGDEAKGCKKSKERITMLLGCCCIGENLLHL